MGNKFNNFLKISNGVDLEIIEQAKAYTKESLGRTKKDLLILQVSSFRPQKDQETLIKAITLLPETYKLILVGKGELQNKYINQVKK